MYCETQKSDEGRKKYLTACYDAKVFISLRILAGGNFAAELIDVGERLAHTIEKRVCFGEKLVLQAHAGYAPLFKFAYKTTRVIEVTISCILRRSYREN